LTAVVERTPLRLAVDAANLAQDRRGMGRIGRALLQEAVKDEHIELTLLAEKRPDVRSLREQFPGISVRRPATARRRRRYDAIWYPFNGMRFDAAAPALVTIHDVFAFTQPHSERVARWREQTPIRRAARDAARILANSTWTRDEIVRVLGVAPERIDIVRPSPDPFWFPALGDELPLGGRRFALLVGVRERRKNARLALEACARALQGPNEALVVVGELDARDRAFARALHVRCAEVAASDELLRALYRNASAVLVPSLAEGFGLVAVEAMACGTATLAADASALPETCAGGALLIDPHDVAAWRDAIRSVVDDDAFATALAARGAARFAFASRSAPGAAYLALLRTLAAR